MTTVPASGRPLAHHAPFSRSAVLFLLLFTALCMARFRYIGTPGDDWHDAINSDGKGYYEYLRMFLFPNPQMHPGKGPLHPGIDAQVIKHFSGAAVAMAPFVLAAHTYTLFNTGKVEDGYSLHYQLAVGLAAWCWLALGLFALRRFLLDIGVRDVPAGITLVLLTLGTGLIVQAVVHPAMSHVYGFAAIALLFQRTRVLLLRPSTRRLMVCAALLGLAVLIRPVDLLVLLALPLAALNARPDPAALKKLLMPRASVPAVAVFVAVVGVQCVLWYLQCGSFFVRPYPGEGFHWGRPEVVNSLFSARNGLFFYWPVLVLIVPGAWMLWRRHRWAAITFLCSAAVFAYVTSCWWNWAYGDNFGQRTYLDMLAVFAVPFAAAVPGGPWPRAAFIIGGIPLCGLNLFQGWQYQVHLLVSGQMDPVRYRYIFLERDIEHVKLVGGFAELPLYAPRGHALVPVPWSAMKDAPAMPGDTVLRDLISAPVPSSIVGSPTYLQVDLSRTEIIPGASRDAWVALVLRKDGTERSILRFRMNLVPDASADRRTWHYAFNMWQHAWGDTLAIKASPARDFRVNEVHASLSVRR